MSGAHRGPRIHLPPPLVVAGWWFAGYGVDRLVPLALPGGWTWLEPLAWVVGGAGALLAGWALTLFALVRTAILPFRPASTLVVRGPYRFSRNPIYAGLLLIYLGVALWTRQLWPVLFLPLAMASLRGLAIDQEESHLREKFGDGYREYCRRVRRWL